jgi:Flp pilus assembly pilin Flp
MNRVHLIFGRLALGVLEARRLASRQQGQALIEYALIISLVAVVAIAGLSLTGTNVKTLLNKVAGEV